jgi:hypothetical protein
MAENDITIETAVGLNTCPFPYGAAVYKRGQGYSGPGVVRGMAQTLGGLMRVIVGHRLSNGTGELLHIYALDQVSLLGLTQESNMPKIDLDDDNVAYHALTLEAAREVDDITAEQVAEWIDEAQALVFSGDHPTAYLVIEIAK